MEERTGLSSGNWISIAAWVFMAGMYFGKLDNLEADVAELKTSLEKTEAQMLVWLDDAEDQREEAQAERKEIVEFMRRLIEANSLAYPGSNVPSMIAR